MVRQIARAAAIPRHISPNTLRYAVIGTHFNAGAEVVPHAERARTASRGFARFRLLETGNATPLVIAPTGQGALEPTPDEAIEKLRWLPGLPGGFVSCTRCRVEVALEFLLRASGSRLLS